MIETPDGGLKKVDEHYESGSYTVGGYEPDQHEIDKLFRSVKTDGFVFKLSDVKKVREGETDPGKVLVRYQDEQGNVIANPITDEQPGKTRYTVSPKPLISYKNQLYTYKSRLANTYDESGEYEAGMTKEIVASNGSELTLKVSRDGSQQEIKVTPKEEISVKKGKEVKTYKLGIDPAYEKDLAGSIKSGFEQTLYYGTTIFMGIINLFASLFNGGFSLNQLGGPVAIYEMSSAAAQSGLITTLKWTGILSVNLGLMNLIPIPVLDGGRIIFVIYEAIFKKPINKKAQYYLTVAFGLLMVALMLAVTWNDVQRLFGK